MFLDFLNQNNSNKSANDWIIT